MDYLKKAYTVRDAPGLTHMFYITLLCCTVNVLIVALTNRD